MFEPAPLIETADAKAPPGGEADWFTGAGGVRLRAALFTPAGRVRGSIVLSGGRTEPIEKYYETIGDFLARGFVVLAHDWRGQGLSKRELPDPLKGHVSGYKAYLDDFRALLGAYSPRLPRPWVAVGHSMGGCLTLLALAHGEDRFAGAVLSAPMLGLKTGKAGAQAARTMASLNVLFGRAGRYVLGDKGKPFGDDFDANLLTHDRARYARTAGLLAAEPQLALGAPTWGWLDFAFKATAYLANPERLRSVTVPVVIVSAEQDKLVDNAAQAAAARHLPQGKFVNVPGAYHEILMETDPMRNFFQKAFDALTGRVAPQPAAPPKPVPATPPAPAAAAPAPPKPAPAPAPAAAAKPARAAKKPAARKPAVKKRAAVKAAAPKPAAAAKPAVPKKTGPAKKARVPKTVATPKPAAAKKSTAPKAAKPAAVKKPGAAKPAAAKKAPAATKAPSAKKAAAPKSVARKPATRKPATRKPAAKAAAAKAAPKAPAKPVAAKKPAAARKSAAKKAPAKT